MKMKLYNPFHCPEGKWPGICEAIEEPKKRMNKSCANQVRVRFSVQTDEGERLVAKTLCADRGYGSELYTFLASWFDGNLNSVLDDDGEIDLDVLVGKKADLLITHGPHGDQYEYPVVNIAGIYPPGHITED